MSKKNILIIATIGIFIALISGSGVFVWQKRVNDKLQNEAVESVKQEMQEQIEELKQELFAENSLVQDQKEVEEINIDSRQVYKNEEFGFELQYPEDWDFSSREVDALFASNGPRGDAFDFLSSEKTIHDSPFLVDIYVVENIQYTDPIAYFDFAHRGDVCVYDGYETVKLGVNQNEFLKITETTGSYISYLKVRDGNFYEISFFNPKVGELYQQADEMIGTFTFDSVDSESEKASKNNSLSVEINGQNKVYQNEKYSFNLTYPKDWIIFQEDLNTNNSFVESYIIRANQRTQTNRPFWLAIRILENADMFDMLPENDPYEIVYIGKNNEEFRRRESAQSIIYKKNKDNVLYHFSFDKYHIESLDQQAEEIIATFTFK